MAVGQRRDILVFSFKEPIVAPEVMGEVVKRVHQDPYRMPLAVRLERCLADAFDIKNFDINKTEFKQGTATSEIKFLTRQENFLYALEGQAAVAVGENELILMPDDCFDFTAYCGIGKILVNRSEKSMRLLEVGHRAPGDARHYPKTEFSPFTFYPDES
ncbi:MAG: hypothetical protein CMM28_04210 [Rhodospirillaceae bacterium]|nr:hypothetical protein [Rhodospirillaceae bacterium]